MKQPGWLRRWRHSIRWRLVTLFVLLALATSAVFLVGLQRTVQGGWQTYARPLLTDYADRLAAEIGSPPDLVRARAIVARLPVTVRIDGPVVRYDSHPRPRWAASHDDEADEQDDAQDDARDAAQDGARGLAPGDGSGRRGGPFSLTRRTADGHVIRFGLAEPENSRPRGAGWATLAALLVLTGVAWAVVRRWLKPLDAIGAGAERYGRGDFGTPIAVPSEDELGDLARRIDRMAGSLHGMLDAKRALLLAISHELRSPLTRARLNAELLPEGPQQAALVRDLAVMRDLITDLLESERLAAGHSALQAEDLDLAALVREVAAQFSGPPSQSAQVAQPGQPPGPAPFLPLTLDLADEIGTVRADPTRIRLMLRNLIDNALEHGADAVQPPTVRLGRDASGAVCLSVRDHGPGVAPEHLPHLAEPFYRPDSARTRAAGGVGLGLTLCHLVAQAHGGTLVLRNAGPGLEAVFRL